MQRRGGQEPRVRGVGVHSAEASARPRSGTSAYARTGPSLRRGGAMSSRVTHRGQGTDMEVSADSRPHPSTVPALLGAAHPGPALAVTVLAALLGDCARPHAGPRRAGDRGRAAAASCRSAGATTWSTSPATAPVGRSDKPLAIGTISPRTVTVACAVAVGLCVVLSLACGWAAGLVHLGCTAAGWAYNLGLKATAWSWRRTPSRSAGCRSSCGWPATIPGCRPGGCRWRRPAWVSAPTCSTCCPTSTTTGPRGSAGCPHRLGARRLPAAAVVVLGAGVGAGAARRGRGGVGRDRRPRRRGGARGRRRCVVAAASRSWRRSGSP